jgi:hypothetical protein
MERVRPKSEPYAYPSSPHQRRHGPVGYSSYESYRPWLEDEFSFRCVYCLKRMVWAPTDVWAIDHLVVQVGSEGVPSDYDNLVFACQCCNRQKSSHRMPDPCQVAYGSCLRVESSGRVVPLNKEGRRLVDTIRLNHVRYVKEREKMIRILRLAESRDVALFEKLMGFPACLHDLSKLDPPGGNLRPDGISESCFARRARGHLPRIY